MFKNALKSIFNTNLVIVGPRPLGQIGQFGIGLFLSIISVITLIGAPSIRYFFPPPRLEELYPVSGFLVNLKVHRPIRGSPWVSFAIRAADITRSARIENYAGLRNKARIVQLKPGDQMTVWFAKQDIAKKRRIVAWEIQSAGKDVLTFEQALNADKEYHQRLIFISLCLFIVGIILLSWGWRISIIEQRRWDRHEWFSNR